MPIKPTMLFFNVNGSGLGHLNRCLSYAKRMREHTRVFFFSLASAMDIIHDMGFNGDYLVSPFWTVNSTYHWNSELALRLGLLLEHLRPNLVVFDGTWPYQGFMSACHAYGRPLGMVWSRRGLLGANAKRSNVDESLFDMVIEPGELGLDKTETRRSNGVCHVMVPPVALLDDDELLPRAEARQQLGLKPQGRYVLLSLGPGNLKRVSGIGQGLVHKLGMQGYSCVWAQSPISVAAEDLPENVHPLQCYPLVRYLRAFDGFVGAAGYNTCCELAQAGIPALLVPNELLADDQARRARMLATHRPVVVSACNDAQQQAQAVRDLTRLMAREPMSLPRINTGGAQAAADAILQLAHAHA